MMTPQFPTLASLRCVAMRGTTLPVALLLLLVLAAQAGRAQAPAAGRQAVQVHASTTAQEVFTGERLRYVLEIRTSDGSQPPDPQLPDFSPFQVINSSRSTGSFQSIVGTRVRAELTLTVEVDLQAPTRTGDFTIPAASAGGVYSRAIVVRVRSDESSIPSIVRDENLLFAYTRPENLAADRQMRGHVFVRPEVETFNPFKRQPVAITWTLYLADSQNVQRLGLANLNWGFLDSDNKADFSYETAYQAREPLRPVEQYVDGRRFLAYRLTTALLVPQRDGQLEVPRFVAQLTMRNPPGGRNSIMVFGPSTVVVPSKPLVLDVRDTPAEGRPANYSGAVGSFSLRLEADRTDARQGEDLVTLRAYLEGRGLGSLQPVPRLAEAPQWSLIDRPRRVRDDTQALDGSPAQLHTTVLWEFLLRPEQPGDHALPRLEYPVFDPSTASYVVLTAQSPRVQVEESADWNAVAAARAAAGNALPSPAAPATPLADDYAYIDTTPWAELTRPYSGDVGQAALPWLLSGLMLALGSFAFHPGLVLTAAATGRPTRRAARHALKAIEKARAMQGASRAQHLDACLRHYLAARLHLAAQGLEPLAVERLLMQRTNHAGLAARVAAMMEALAAEVYAPGSMASAGEDAASSPVDQLAVMIRELEAALDAPQLPASPGASAPVALLLAAMLAAPPHLASAQEPTPAPGAATVYRQAADAFAAGNFAQARDHYLELIGEGEASIELWYNLGTALARTNRPYEALWMFRRVLHHQPAHAGARHNAEVVAQRLGLTAPAAASGLEGLRRATAARLAPVHAFMAHPLTLLLVFGMIGASVLGNVAAWRMNAPRLRRLAWALLLPPLLVTAWVAGAVLAPPVPEKATALRRTDIWSGPSAESFTKLGELTPGATVPLLTDKAQGQFLKVELPDGRSGFVAESDLGRHREWHGDARRLLRQPDPHP